jgi:glutaminyl-tRNA synthetase
MPTIAGFRRRGYTPEAIRDFSERIGVARADNKVEISYLEHCLREDLNKRAPRVMVVLRPLKVVIDNYPDEQVEELEAVNNPEDASAGNRKVPFSKVIYIEQDDFREDPPKKFHRLSPGKEVRLKHGYYITCTEVVKDEKTGEIIEVHCTYDPATRGGWSDDGRKVKGTLHWVSAEHALPVEVRLYDHLFINPDPEEVEEGKDFLSNINPNSLKLLTACLAEPSLLVAKPGDRFQFLRHGYFSVDPDTDKGKLVFNRTVSLKDSWAKIEKSQNKK